MEDTAINSISEETSSSASSDNEEINYLKAKNEELINENQNLKDEINELKNKLKEQEKALDKQEVRELDIIKKYCPAIKESLLFNNYLIGLTDADKMEFVFYSKARNLDLAMGDTLVGKPVMEGTLNHDVIIQRKRIIKEFTKEESKYDVPYIAGGVPLINDEGKVIGSFAVAISKNAYEQITGLSSSLISVSQQLDINVRSFRNKTAAIIDNVILFNNKVKEYIEKFDRIITLSKAIKTVADQTKIISINASIEAARAGEAGRGFAIVSKEIGKLAQKAHIESSQIDETVAMIQEDFNNIMDIFKKVEEKAGEFKIKEDILFHLGKDIKEIADDVYEKIEAQYRIIN